MIESSAFQRRLQIRRISGALFAALCLGATIAGIGVLGVLLFTVAGDGIGRVSWDFVNSFPSRHPEEAGIKAALYGTLWLMGFTALFAVPLGIGAAVYLEEFAPKNWITRVIETNINNLAGVPSIVYGILGLAVFVRAMDSSSRSLSSQRARACGRSPSRSATARWPLARRAGRPSDSRSCPRRFLR
jgi:phosphate transport system permease protein